MIKKPKTTLYMLMSLDGKISTGATDKLDFDKDLPKIKGVNGGLKQYYDIEKTTDSVSFNSGRVMEKIGVNTKNNPIKSLKFVRFVLVDNKPNLNKQGILNLTKNLKELYIITTNKNHPANKLKIDNLKVLYYPKKIDFKQAFNKLNTEFAVKRMTIQSGGTLNTTLIREGLIDRVSIVIVPCLVGGKDTSTPMDGNSLTSINELKYIKALKLHKINRLRNSYLHLIYYVQN
jgi:2,5-diamino-6-(ribosylamino)-4(3H)-pyrimidinone 5'-phosphate reductase